MAVPTPSSSCTYTYKTVALAPGESYVLPAGAQIIGATDLSGISSTNNCANLDDVETLACYAIEVVENEASQGPYDDVVVTGVKIGDNTYTFSSGITFPNDYSGIIGVVPTATILDFQNALDSVGLSGILSDWSGWGKIIDDTAVTMLCFRVVPSIGNILSFIGIGQDNGGGPNVPINVPVLPSSDLLSEYLGGGGYDEFVNACGCNNPI